jgi:hypothetical protein
MLKYCYILILQIASINTDAKKFTHFFQFLFSLFILTKFHFHHFYSFPHLQYNNSFLKQFTKRLSKLKLKVLSLYLAKELLKFSNSDLLLCRRHSVIVPSTPLVSFLHSFLFSLISHEY